MLYWHLHPFQGEFKKSKVKTNDSPADEYEIYGIATRLGITSEDMKNMSFVSLYNTIISCTAEETERKATQEDINAFLGSLRW